MSEWRLAKSLEQFRKQVNAAFPDRDKSSDGTIGDTRHAATKSEHNPDTDGVVRAIDITNDPAHGLSARALAEALVASRDPRILYVISNRQINNSRVSPWTWRPYNGVNAHEHHMHLSVVENSSLYDNTAPWNLTVKIVKPIPQPKEPEVTTTITTTTVAAPTASGSLDVAKIEHLVEGLNHALDQFGFFIPPQFKWVVLIPKVIETALETLIDIQASGGNAATIQQKVGQHLVELGQKLQIAAQAPIDIQGQPR